MQPHHQRARLLVAATIALVVACSPAPEAPTATLDLLAGHDAHARASGGDLTPAQKQAIAEVRQATARFHDIEEAWSAGYTQQYPAGCAQSSAGAQGFHYLNPDLVDGTLNVLEPELVMYEPQPNGSLQLVGADYIIPFTEWTSSTPPTLLGMPLGRNEPLGVWAIHIWAWRPNPSGMFAAWNPKVSCEHAQ